MKEFKTLLMLFFFFVCLLLISLNSEIGAATQSTEASILEGPRYDTIQTFDLSDTYGVDLQAISPDGKSVGFSYEKGITHHISFNGKEIKCYTNGGCGSFGGISFNNINNEYAIKLIFMGSGGVPSGFLYVGSNWHTSFYNYSDQSGVFLDETTFVFVDLYHNIYKLNTKYPFDVQVNPGTIINGVKVTIESLQEILKQQIIENPFNLNFYNFNNSTWFNKVKSDSNIDRITDPYISPDGNKRISLGKKGKKVFVVLDKKQILSPGFDEIKHPIFYNKSNKVIYNAREKNKWFVMVDNIKISPGFDQVLFASKLFADTGTIFFAGYDNKTKTILHASCNLETSDKTTEGVPIGASPSTDIKQ